LGFSIDVACGGIDNLVRHHDYNIAISEAASGKAFCRYWLHGGHLFVDGKKMSKSKGNVYYTTDVTAKGFSGEQLRFFLIYGPYRKKLNFTWEKIKVVSQKLESLKKMVSDIQESKSIRSDEKLVALAKTLVPVFEGSLNNDLDIKGAFDNIYETICELHKKRDLLTVEDVKNILDDLKKIDGVLQCLF
jgi:cysteinyl-tRNA synthetase